jgi:hypothetical protein
MTASRLLLASALALAWCWSAWHEDLEAAGWMFAHEHHHPHPTAADAASDHAPGHADDEASAHQPVWARDHAPEIRLGLPWLLIALAPGLGLASLPPWPSSILLPVAGRRRPPWIFGPGGQLPGHGVPAETGPPGAR